MLGVNQSDFMSYMSALKSNYRKGVHRMEAILSNPTHAKEFAANLGGVSVVLGVPISMPDRNSDKLLELLLGSAVADNAVETWLHQFYEFTDWDDLLSDSARCQEMANNPLIWRAAGGSKLAVGKSIATLAGLSCSAYKDIDAVAASSTAMAAVAASSTAMTAVINNATALNAVVTSSTAMAAIIANATALNAVVTSSTAMTAVGNSITSMSAISASSTALTALCNSPLAVTTNASTWGSSGTLLTGKRILVGFSQKQYSDGNYLSTLGSKTAGSGSGDFTITLNAANYNKYQPMAVVVNPLVLRSNDWGGNFSSSYINGVKTIPIS